jgi:hypothetical protein
VHPAGALGGLGGSRWNTQQGDSVSLLAPIYPRVQTVCEEIIGNFDAKRFSLRLYSKTNDALVLFAAHSALTLRLCNKRRKSTAAAGDGCPPPSPFLPASMISDPAFAMKVTPVREGRARAKYGLARHNLQHPGCTSISRRSEVSVERTTLEDSKSCQCIFSQAAPCTLWASGLQRLWPG